ncbi:MAG: hypothetical protein U0T82_16325 [Bacteroidales bacterium]
MNRKTMTKIEKIISDKYANANELISLIQEFKLIDIINNAIEQVSIKFINGQIEDLPRLSGIILNDINSYLCRIKDMGKKKKIEYLLSDVFQDFLYEIEKHPNAKILVNEIQLNMKEACEYSGYNYDIISTYLNLQKHQILLPKSIQKDIYYNWNGNDKDLDELAKDLKDMRIINSVKEFKRMFKPIQGHLSVHFNIERYKELLILFQILKEFRLITPKGTSGHFAPLVQYAVDNDGDFLIKKSANKEHEKLKRNKAEYKQLWHKLEEIVRINTGNSMRQ